MTAFGRDLIEGLKEVLAHVRGEESNVTERRLMSYARFGWNKSDVYLYESDEGFVCCGCNLNPLSQVLFGEPGELAQHCLIHREAGDTVPQYAIDALLKEQKELEDGKEQLS